MKIATYISACLMLPLLAGCQQPTTYRPNVTQEEIRAEEANQQRMVEEAGEKGGTPRPWRNHPGMRKQFERVAGRIEKAGAALCQDIGLPKKDRRCYYYFDTSRDEEINAFADGKNIVVAQGMQRFVESDDELAVVLGHELAHNLMGHIDAHKDNAITGLLVGAVLDGIAASQGMNTSGDFAKSGMEAGGISHSVSFEQEADYIGLYIAARAGYNIKVAPQFWRRMSVEDPRGIYTSKTHPSNAERSASMQKTIAEISAKRKQHLALVPEFEHEMASQ
jgi:predicted Zn-dependent protease